MKCEQFAVAGRAGVAAGQCDRFELDEFLTGAARRICVNSGGSKAIDTLADGFTTIREMVRNENNFRRSGRSVPAPPKESAFSAWSALPLLILNGRLRLQAAPSDVATVKKMTWPVTICVGSLN